MKFYFDGQPVKETDQSPDYKMTTLLGIYENDSPLWSGTPDYDSEYPKRVEIDYFRAYKTDEMLAWDAAESRTPAAGGRTWRLMPWQVQHRTGIGTVRPAI